MNNRQEFYEWFSQVEAERAHEREGKYRQYGDVLKGHLALLDELLSSVQETLLMFDALVGKKEGENERKYMRI